MKHYIFSIILFIAICIGSFFSHNYTNGFINKTSATISKFNNTEVFNAEYLNDIEMIKDNFFTNKLFLQLFLNKEHIQDIESKILLLENSIKNQNIESMQENSIELISLLKHAQSSLSVLS